MTQNRIIIVQMCTFLLSLLSFSSAMGQAKEEEEPVNVTYRKGCIYDEAQYNLPSIRQYFVHRDKTFADGRVVTETSRSIRWHPTEGVDDSGWRNDVYESGIGDHLLDNGSLLRYGPRLYDGDDVFGRQSYESGQCFRVFYHSIGVPDLSKLRWEEIKNDDNWGSMQDLYKYSLGGNGVYYFNPDALQNVQEGWYYNLSIGATFSGRIKYDGFDLTFRYYSFGFQNIGYLLYADGRLFDFYDYKPNYDVDFRMKDWTMSNGSPAKIYTYECRRKFEAGPDDYWAIVDTIYQLSPAEAKQWKPVPSVISYQIGNDKMVSERPFSESMMKEDERNIIWRKYE